MGEQMTWQTLYEIVRFCEAAELIDLTGDDALRRRLETTTFRSTRLPEGTPGGGEEGPIDGPELELVGALALFVSAPTSGASTGKATLPSSKQVKSGAGTLELKAVKNQQQKFKVQYNFGCKDGSTKEAPEPLANE